MLKALFDNGALQSAVPPAYCLREPRPGGCASAVEQEIPTIDFSLLCDGTNIQRSEAVKHLGEACREWGFFAVVNHGVTIRTMEAMLAAAHAFYSLPKEEKREYAGKHVLDPIRWGTSFNPAVEDVKYWRDFFKMIVHPDFSSPANPLGFREALQDYAGCLRKLALGLLRGINESLGLEEHAMERALDLDSGLQMVVGNFYPPCPQPQLAMGLPPHSDHGLLTILLQNGVDGLEVKHGGRWVRVRPPPDSFLVNTGDHMEIFSNGRYKSVLHRAVLNSHSTRVSLVVVQGPSLEAYVEPAPQLVGGDGGPAAYRGMKYRDYIEHQQQKPLKEKSALDVVRIHAGGPAAV